MIREYILAIIVGPFEASIWSCNPVLIFLEVNPTELSGAYDWRHMLSFVPLQSDTGNYLYPPIWKKSMSFRMSWKIVIPLKLSSLVLHFLWTSYCWEDSYCSKHLLPPCFSECYVSVALHTKLEHFCSIWVCYLPVCWLKWILVSLAQSSSDLAVGLLWIMLINICCMESLRKDKIIWKRESACI